MVCAMVTTRDTGDQSNLKSISLIVVLYGGGGGGGGRVCLGNPPGIPKD